MRTLDWVLSQQDPCGGFYAWPGSDLYPECTGYLIPTLLQWGQQEAAERAADWLASIQHETGAWRGMDGALHAFDTAAVVEGLSMLEGYEENVKKGEAWLNDQELAPSRLYLWRANGIIQKEVDNFDIHFPVLGGNRTHYAAYALEGIWLLGHTEFVQKRLDKLPRGMQPYLVGGEVPATSDTCATAQIAKLRLLMGMEADQEIAALRRLVRSDGSLPHDLNNPKQVIWACKYMLDVEKLLENQRYDDVWYKVREWEFHGFNIDMRAWKAQHPFGISGCFRVRNDHEFLYEAIASHLPYLDEAVIALQPSDEATELVVRRLQKEFPEKVRVERYPVAPVFITDSEWESVPENSIRSFVYLSNWALSKCRYSWIARIEADVICLSSFAKIRERIEQEPEAKRLYGRVILNVAGKNRDQVSATVPRNGGWDQCVFPNHPANRFVRRPKYEVLDWSGEAECMGWSALHMKRSKSDKIGWNNETYVPFTPGEVAKALFAFNASNPYPGPDNPLGDPCLFEKTLVSPD